MRFILESGRDRDLRPGDRGRDVRTVVEYLIEYGYIASSQSLQMGGKRTGAEARPLILAPEHPEVFDERLEEALRLFQRTYRLEETGTLNAETLELMSTPRCGVPDNPQLGFGVLSNPVCAWPRRELTYRIVETLSSLGPREHKRVFEACLREWSRVSGLVFTESDQVSRIQSFIYNGDGCGGTFAYAFFPCDGTVAGDTHFDDNDCWSTASVTPGNQVDFFSVCLHEIGHALGLGHEPGVRDAVMYPYFQLGEQRRAATRDDIQGIKALYP